MGFLSVTLNIFTLLVIAAVFYIAMNLYRTRPENLMQNTPSEVFNDMWIEPSTVTHAFFNEPEFGPIGNFYGYDWEKTKLDLTNF